MKVAFPRQSIVRIILYPVAMIECVAPRTHAVIQFEVGQTIAGTSTTMSSLALQ